MDKSSARSIDRASTFSKTITQDIVFAMLMLCALILQLWKCRYGFGGYDEAFYLTIPNRLIQGDALFTDEWHLSQLSGVLLLPFVRLYTLITHSTEGIILADRVVYICIHLLSSAFIYTRLRKYGYASVAACVLFFIFTPFDIMALSYNTMGLDAVAVSGTLFATADYGKKVPLILSGVIFSAGVLCCPYLAGAYVIFFMCILVGVALRAFNKTQNIFTSAIFSWKVFWWVSVGIAVAAAVFLLYFFSKTSIGDVVNNLPHMLADPEHPPMTIGEKIGAYFDAVVNNIENFNIPLYSYIALLVIMIVDRRRKTRRGLYLAISCIIFVVAEAVIIPFLMNIGYNFIMFPMIFVGITSYILIDNKPRELLAGLFFLGILYSFAICFGSNQYFFVISFAVSVSNIASLIFVGILVDEIRAEKPKALKIKAFNTAALVLTAVVVIIQGALQLAVKTQHIFCDFEPSRLPSKISCGPAKGIYTSPQNKQSCEILYNDLIKSTDGLNGNLLCLTPITWCYLAAEDMRCASFSSWISGETPETVERIKEYYKVNPAKRPDYIYIPKCSTWDFTNIYPNAENAGYTVSESDISYMLSKTA